METIHELIHELSYKIETGNIDGAKKLLPAMDELAHDVIAKKKHDGRLPSRFTFGDKVHVNLNDAGIIRNAQVIKIHFTLSKVFYDLEVKSSYPVAPEEGESAFYTRLYNIDSSIVESAG